VVTRQLKVERRTGSVRRPKTGVPPTVLRSQLDLSGGYSIGATVVSYDEYDVVTRDGDRLRSASTSALDVPPTRCVTV